MDEKKPQFNAIRFCRRAEAAVNAYLGLSNENRLAIGILFPNHSVGCYTSNCVSQNSRFDIGSISKTFTAQIILKLVCDKKISLDKTADVYLSLKKSGTYPTVEQLLTHTAGYGHATPLEITLPALLAKRYLHANPYRNADRARVLAALSRRNRTKPQNPYGYSDFAYAILALIAENVTHKPFFELMNEYLQDVCGMTDSEAFPTSPRIKSVSNGKQVTEWTWDRENPYIAGGGLVSTVADMIRYASLQLNPTEPYQTLAQKVCPQSFSSHSNVGTCLGWHTYKKSNQLWHVGGVGAFRSSMILNQHLGCAVIVLGNAKGKKSANVHYLAKLLYSELKKNKLSTLQVDSNS